jgi:hypothetical protein
MDKVAQSKKILTLAHKMTKAVEAEVEEILEHAEAVVKEYVPARYHKAALTKIEKVLDNEGIEAKFDKAVTREQLRATAKVEVEGSEVNEVVTHIANAVVAELEDILKDADEVADEVVAKCDLRNRFEVESKLKGVVEKKLAAKGVYVKFSRTAKKSK